ncbi:hypothetical protein AMK59_1176, partial [Oryctes borbonicus]
AIRDSYQTYCFLYLNPFSSLIPEMAKTVYLGIFLSTLLLATFVNSSPLFTGICIKNCAQCKEMYGKYFYGQLCADSCVKYKGSIIPNCEDIASIAPFLILNDDLS